jgi:hypothetical protein
MVPGCMRQLRSKVAMMAWLDLICEQRNLSRTFAAELLWSALKHCVEMCHEWESAGQRDEICVIVDHKRHISNISAHGGDMKAWKS